MSLAIRLKVSSEMDAPFWVNHILSYYKYHCTWKPIAKTRLVCLHTFWCTCYQVSKFTHTFSNSLIIHQFTNQSKYVNLATCTCLDTSMEHWTEAFKLYFDEISKNAKPHWWRIYPNLFIYLLLILFNLLMTQHQSHDNRSFWRNHRPQQWVLIPDVAFATLRVFHKSIYFCTEWTWVPRFEPY